MVTKLQKLIKIYFNNDCSINYYYYDCYDYYLVTNYCLYSCNHPTYANSTAKVIII